MIKPKRKPEHLAYRVEAGIVICPATYPVGSVISDPGWAWTLLQAADGTRTPQEITAMVAAAHHEAGAGQIAEALELLIAAGHMEDAGAPYPDGITAAVRARYDRQVRYFAWADKTPRQSPWDTLSALLGSSVTVIGTGAAMALAASGVGRLHLVQAGPPDTRSAGSWFPPAGPGSPPATLARAAGRIRQLNSSVQVTVSEPALTSPDDVAALLPGTDVLVVCAAPAAAFRPYVNRACLALGIPWVDAGWSGGEVTAATYIPGTETACWECHHAAAAPGTQAPGNPPPGTAGAAPAIMAGMAGYLGAGHAISLITGVPPARPGTAGIVCLTDVSTSRAITYPRQDHCPACAGGTAPAPRPAAGQRAAPPALAGPAPGALQRARVTVIGMGGTGGMAAMALAGSGIGDLTVIDPDVVAESNLTRQLQFTEADIGLSKADLAATVLRQLNPAARVTASRARITSADDVTALLPGCDVLLLAADEPPALREWVNTACLAAGTPWVDAGYHGPVVQAGIYNPAAGTACWECHHSRSRETEESERTHPQDAPAAGTARYQAVGAVPAGVSGLMAAHGVLSLLTPGAAPGGVISMLNLLAPEASYEMREPRRDSCRACSAALPAGPGHLTAAQGPSW